MKAKRQRSSPKHETDAEASPKAAMVQMSSERAPAPLPVSAPRIGPGIGLPDNPPTRGKDEPLRPGDFIVGAARIAVQVAAKPGDSLNASDRRHAEWWLSRAEEPLRGEQLDLYAGGELSPTEARPLGAPALSALELHNTVTNADLVNADASRERLELARDAGALETGLDAAETIGAANSLEKMLAHQMAALHGSTMKMMAQLNACIARMENARYDPKDGPDSPRERANIQATRLAGAIARMNGAFQQGMTTVHKMRSGGRQVVTVQHVHQQVQVSEGGQALVAGRVHGRPGVRAAGRATEDE